MDKKVIHDAVGHTRTVWLGDPAEEHICEETAEELVVMKDAATPVIGFELLHCHLSEPPEPGLAGETVIRIEA
ncbi:MAG TPA: DUF2283 domain-containing protein [Candidatus Dormibacteraeota bacterium]|nr:DUF2283 domain-containing protein [Candidatus Dormibacteraeota bacterium]